MFRHVDVVRGGRSLPEDDAHRPRAGGLCPRRRPGRGAQGSEGRPHQDELLLPERQAVSEGQPWPLWGARSVPGLAHRAQQVGGSPGCLAVGPFCTPVRTGACVPPVAVVRELFIEGETPGFLLAVVNISQQQKRTFFT